MSQEQLQQIRAARDRKAHTHFAQYAPVWLVDEKPRLEEDVLQFGIVFYHPAYHWVKRSYRYDAFSDVLYFNGQLRITEEEALALQNQDPYLEANSLNTVQSYGG